MNGRVCHHRCRAKRRVSKRGGLARREVRDEQKKKFEERKKRNKNEGE